MAILSAVVTTAYISFNSGPLAGLDNVLLHPRATLGLSEDFALTALPDWHQHLNIYMLYGNADTGTGRSSDRIQEVRGDFTSLYTFYRPDPVLRFSAGLYGELAYPLQHYVPYYTPTAQTGYSLEENESIGNETLVGADLNTALDYDRLSTSLHTVFFFTGNRIGPNLLAYAPLLGFDWTNSFYLVGTAAKPRFSIYLNSKFWFARKGGTSIFNTHDGIGGTKREIDLTVGAALMLNHSTRLYAESYGYNNINRGTDTSKPNGYTDGFITGISYRF